MKMNVTCMAGTLQLYILMSTTLPYRLLDLLPMPPTELQRRQAGGPSKKTPRSAAYAAAKAALTEADVALLQLHSAETAESRKFADADSATGWLPPIPVPTVTTVGTGVGAGRPAGGSAGAQRSIPRAGKGPTKGSARRTVATTSVNLFEVATARKVPTDTYADG